MGLLNRVVLTNVVLHVLLRVVTNDAQQIDVKCLPAHTVQAIRTVRRRHKLEPLENAFWPAVRKIVQNRSSTIPSKSLALSPSFSIAVEQDVPFLQRAAHRTCDQLEKARRHKGKIERLTILFDAESLVKLHFPVDESYSLVIRAKSCVLQANTQFGIVQGLRTFSQMFDDPAAKFRASLPTTIIDAPKSKWRGMLLDTARHFYPVQDILRFLKAMALNKYNTFHWHLTDAQSFPLELNSHPELAKKGAWSKSEIYTESDVNQVVHFAAERGIRVVPEVDMPGHIASLGLSHPSLVTHCGKLARRDAKGHGLGKLVPDDVGLQVLDKRAVALAKDILSDLARLFPDRYIHMGADEANYRCWSQDPRMVRRLAARRMTPQQAFGRFVEAAAAHIRSLGKKPIVWQDAYEAIGRRLPLGCVIETWKDRYDNGADGCALNATMAGYEVLQSQGFYLDQDRRWEAMFEGAGTSGLVEEVGDSLFFIGVEACLWSERVSPKNLDCRTWPRGSAVASRMWANPNEDHPVITAQVLSALRKMQKRLVRNGIGAASLEQSHCRGLAPRSGSGDPMLNTHFIPASWAKYLGLR